LQVKKYNDNIEEFRSNSNEEIKEIRNNIKSFRDRENIGFSSSRESIDKASIGIDEASDKIISLEEGKIKYSETIRSIEAEIGPLKYVASLIEDWGGPKVDSGTAVRLVIIVIMVVFDPLAILLLLAAQISFGQASKKEITTYNKLYKKILREPVEVIVPVILPEDENDDDFNVVVSPGKGD
jgi:CO/xanthine dehydrogenase FAD-binding subunit